VAAARKKQRRMSAAKTGAKPPVAPRRRASAIPSKQEPAPLPTLPSAPTTPGFLIVGIGASAGGLEAMEEFFHHIPPSSGMAFVVVSHQPAGHVTLLPGLLGKCTVMSVVEATDGITVEPDHVYLAPGGTNLAMLHGTVHLMEPSPRERVPLPIDYFFRSLADDHKQRAVGIILSGTGSDGSIGLRAIKAESGMTIAQDPQTAKYQGMPRSAIAAGVVDVVTPAGQMAEPLLAYARSLTKPIPSLPEHDAAQTLQKLFILLRDRTGNDFALYKKNAIRRRLERRMNVHQIENVRHYLRFVQENPHELDTLFQELLINVTGFFRDPEAFEVLAQKGLPALLEGRPDGSTLRIWVAGCSTGEEAYSLAIIVRECLAQHKRRLAVQIFASDLDNRAVETARTGIYPVGIAGDVTPDRLQRFFTKEDGSYRIKKEIRDLVVFATHNLLTDAPFTKLDMLSCRNLLIYLDAKAQHKLLLLFHYALKPNGLLFLGTSETVGGFEHVFTPIDRKGKLFRRTAEPSTLPHLERIPGGAMRGTIETRIETGASLPAARPLAIADLIQHVLVAQYAPAAVVINGRGEIVHIHGHTGAYLEPAPGPPTHQLVEMAREGLQRELAVALQRAAGQEDEVVRRNVQMKADGGMTLVTVTVKRITEPEALQGLFLVTFVPEGADKTVVRKGAPKRAVATLKTKKGEAGLRQELEFTKQRLQRMIEELQTSNEELKSTNEELQSTNEELQSANEELETAKEEMQSMNEELMTVNAELQSKFDAFENANDDLENLLNSTEVATIFLDNELRIKRFTSEAKRVSHLIALDVGRPLSDIVSKLTYDRILADAQDVLRTLVMQEQEVQASDGSWFMMRIMPYRTSKNIIDGLVLTFLDVTKMKHAERVVQEARELAASIVETMREPLLVLDDQLRVVLANQSFYRMFQTTLREVEQQLLYHLCNGAWNIPDLRSLLEVILPEHRSFRDFIVDKPFPQVGRKKLALNGRRLEQDVALPGRILLAMEEIVDRDSHSGGEGLGAERVTPTA
jgi:two-component system, chemotaxis family, CheB/CheR fusion protein